MLKIGKKGKELNGCHWLKIWLSDVSATTVAFFSKRWKMQMLKGRPARICNRCVIKLINEQN
jgi:hypothetical protein